MLMEEWLSWLDEEVRPQWQGQGGLCGAPEQVGRPRPPPIQRCYESHGAQEQGQSLQYCRDQGRQGKCVQVPALPVETQAVHCQGLGVWEGRDKLWETMIEPRGKQVHLHAWEPVPQLIEYLLIESPFCRQGVLPERPSARTFMRPGTWRIDSVTLFAWTPWATRTARRHSPWISCLPAVECKHTLSCCPSGVHVLIS